MPVGKDGQYIAFITYAQSNVLRQGGAGRGLSVRHSILSNEATYRIEKYEEVVGPESVGDDKDKQVGAIKTGYDASAVWTVL